MNSATVTPHSLDAEQAVLGAILVDNSRFDAVAEIITPSHFFRDAHRWIFEAMIALNVRNEAVDFVTILQELTRNERKADIGGPTYLASLGDCVPRSSNAEHYATIVRSYADRRDVMAAANKILADVADEEAETRDVLDRAEAALFAISQQQSRGDFIHAPQFAQEGFAAVTKLLETKGGASGVPSGFFGFDEMTRGFQPGALTLIAARPSMGKSAFAMNVAYHAAALKYHVGFISLEMSREELFVRLLASVGGIDSHRLQGGHAKESDYGRMSQAVSDISESYLHIDDSPLVGMLDVRGKARRLMKQHGLSLLIIDYLQLMQMMKSENRNLAVAEVSRGLKLLARELKIPIVALSQLSRETEKRGDKKPMLSDLRDCLPLTARIALSDGREVTLGDIVANRASGNVLSLGDDWKLNARRMTEIWPVGKKPMVVIRTATGRALKCSTEHKVFTEHGWQPAHQIAKGTLVGLPRRIPQLERNTVGISESRALLLGWLIGDGCFHGSPAITVADDADAQLAVALGAEWHGLNPSVRAEHARTSAKRVVFSTGRLSGAGKNPLTNWLRSLGMWKTSGTRKHIPSEIFASSDEAVAAFLRGLFHADGTLTVAKAKNRSTVKLTAIAPEVARGTHALLSRLGIVSCLTRGRNDRSGFRARTSENWTVGIYTNREISTFLDRVGFLGEKHRRAVDRFRLTRVNGSAHIDRLPAVVNERATALRHQRGWSHAQLGWRVQGKKAMSRATCARLAEKLDDAILARWANSDLLWDRAVAVEPQPNEEAYDLSVDGLHNFIVDGFLTHNSGALEQDADVVVFIHRPEVHAWTMENAGAAEIIIAKHRNGPTGCVDLRWNKEFTRFEDPVAVSRSTR